MRIINGKIPLTPKTKSRKKKGMTEDTKKLLSEKIVQIIHEYYQTWENRIKNCESRSTAMRLYPEPTITAASLRDELAENYFVNDEFQFSTKKRQYKAVYNELQKLVRAEKIGRSLGMANKKEQWLYEPARYSN